jgi:DNA-binding NarL/FixJ family response regulator
VAPKPFSSIGSIGPDVTLMDLRLPDLSGIDAMITIRAEFPQARIITLTNSESEEMKGRY